MSIIPPRSSNRTPARSPVWANKTKTYIIPILMTALLIQVLFLGNMSYLFGALFKSGHRMHNLKILAIDYDGGDIGKAISGAYSTLQSNQFPTVEFGSSSEYDTPDKIRDAVCKHGYWGAVYTHPGASSRLLTTIKGDNVTTYDPKDAVTTIYNGAYYPAVFSSVKGSLQSLTTVASNMYPITSSDILKAVNLTNPASASTFLNPFQSSVWDIMPTEQGSRVLLNTVAMVMAVLMQFFFQMAFNGITAKVLQSQSKRDVYIFRLVTGKAYTFVSALGMTGYIWAFRENWGVDAGQFFETWMCLWFYMDINYLVVDTVIGTVIPMQFFAFFLLTWIIINIASTVYPFDLTPGFFHWAWALPAHNVWLLLVGIWSGCRASIDVTLPILFSWWIVGHASSAWSVRKRCLMAGVEAKVQSHNDTTDEFDRYSTEHSQQMVLQRMNDQGSRQNTNDQNIDLEANRLGQSQRNGDDSRTVINGAMSPGVRDDAKEQTI
ncbi:nitrosoguanidine resistance sng1 [Fusarium sporotrichioides]|uniref:Nitrosoguanidine resistance sng1 n=1 Tax=Fusarium sporotrichioides TaxID=5514 RepID=A0A395S7X6_FUSSP|nr:nitrosoguanidine resistance sng1 [Fusarium sporotrichioides]